MSDYLDAEILAGLRELNSDDPKFIKEFMALFLETAPPRMESLNAAIQSKNAKLIAQEAHALKSSCSSVGAKVMTELCFDLEKMGKANDIALAPDAFQALERAFAAAKADILNLPEMKAA